MNERMKAVSKAGILFRITIFWIAVFISQLMFLSSSFVSKDKPSVYKGCV